MIVPVSNFEKQFNLQCFDRGAVTNQDNDSEI